MIRILKIGTCPSLSNRSILTYHIGCKGNEIYLRLFNNSERGLFSKEWIGLDRFELSKEEPISARSIHEHFQGKSANTAGFLMAVLKNEGLIQPMEEKSRTYKRCDPSPFKSAISTLMESEVSLEAAALTQPPKTAGKKGRKG